MNMDTLIEDYQTWAASVNDVPEGRYLSTTNVLLFALLKELENQNDQ